MEVQVPAPPAPYSLCMILRHRIAVTLFLLSVVAFAVWFAFVYTWPMTLDPRID